MTKLSARPNRYVVAPRSTVDAMTEAWELSLRARNLAPTSVHSYTKQVRRFATWCRDRGEPVVLADVGKAQVERYLAESRDHGAAAKSLRDYYGSLLVFFRWCVAEGEIARHPMEGIKPPIVPESPPPVLSDDELRRLLRMCEGGDFVARRNMALLRLLIDTGLRRSEVAGLTVGDLDLEKREAAVRRKFRRDGVVVFGHAAALALARYLRIREAHPDAATSDKLWLGRMGPIDHGGIYAIVRHLGQAAGLEGNIWPHLFRHSWAHNWLADGGQEHDLMELADWRGREMIGRYGAALRGERARDAARNQRLGDRL